MPAVRTLEKLARALEIPLYIFFYDERNPSKPRNTPKREAAGEVLWGSEDKDAQDLLEFCRLFGRMKPDKRELIFLLAEKMAGRGKY